MNRIILNNGVSMPILGFGVYQMEDADCERCVAQALETGYRLIDTAAAYGNERAVGRAIAASGVPRDELFVTTKLWVSDSGESRTKDAFERSCENLGLETIDLYLVHQPFGDYYGSWRAMQRLNRAGRIRAIGVSNFHGDRLADLIVNSEIAPAVNQIEMHPFFHRVADQEFMSAHGVQAESWGPFAEGRNGIFGNPVLRSVAENHGRTVAQVILRWLVQRNVVAIPKSANRERIAENFDVFDFELTSQDMAAIAALDTRTSAFLDCRDPEIAFRMAGFALS